DTEDAVAQLELLRIRAGSCDSARHLDAGDVGRRAGRRWIATCALRHVGRVEPCIADVDEHLAAAGCGVAALLELHHLVPAGSGEDDSSHRTGRYRYRSLVPSPASTASP